MTSTVDERRIKIQEYNVSIEGVRTAPNDMPDRLNESWLPCAITYPAPAIHSLAAVGRRREERSYLVRLYVKPFEAGKDTHQGFAACLPFLERFPEKYLTRATIEDDTWEQLTFTEDAGDGGVGVIPLHGVANEGAPRYWGVVFEITVIYKENL